VLTVRNLLEFVLLGWALFTLYRLGRSGRPARDRFTKNPLTTKPLT
jgi:hypothetical protein